jgi:hypothetical protein
MDVLKEESS